MPPTHRTAAESFAALLTALVQAVVTRHLVGQLSQSLNNLIIDRLRGINQIVARIATRVAAGRYRRRSVAAPHGRAGIGKPRRPDLLPKTSGWLLKLVPGSVGSYGQLENIFRDAEMVALMEAAPASLARPLRSLCRMLGVTPPPILAAPVRRAELPARRDAAPPPPTPHPPPSEGTTETAPPPVLVLPRACGPPHPA